MKYDRDGEESGMTLRRDGKMVQAQNTNWVM